MYSQNYQLVSAEEIRGKITYSKPEKENEKEIIVKEWISKQGKFWPLELSANIILKEHQLIYIPIWILFGKAEGTWSASVGIEHWRYEICNSCSGRGGEYRGTGSDRHFSSCWRCSGSGQLKKFYTAWGSQSGVVNVEMQGSVVNNFSPEIEFKTGKIDLDAVEEDLSEYQAKEMIILKPNFNGSEEGINVARIELKSRLNNKANLAASNIGKVRNLQVSYINIDNLSSRIWLYPMLIGEYSFEEENLGIQMDMCTGEVFIQTPKSVIIKRRNQSISISIAVLGIIALIIFILTLTN